MTYRSERGGDKKSREEKKGKRREKTRELKGMRELKVRGEE